MRRACGVVGLCRLLLRAPGPPRGSLSNDPCGPTRLKPKWLRCYSVQLWSKTVKCRLAPVPDPAPAPVPLSRTCACSSSCFVVFILSRRHIHADNVCPVPLDRGSRSQTSKGCPGSWPVALSGLWPLCPVLADSVMLVLVLVCATRREPSKIRLDFLVHGST